MQAVHRKTSDADASKTTDPTANGHRSRFNFAATTAERALQVKQDTRQSQN